SWWHNRELRVGDVGYTDDFICDRAIEFIDANKERPFFCYIPFHLVHAPLQAKDDELARVPTSIEEGDKQTYFAMTLGLDDRIKRILDKLDELKLADNTIVVFFSDNGATPTGSNLPLRGGKHSLYEGGVHSPAVIRWPKGGLSGGEYDGMWGCVDLFPTLVAMTGHTMPQTKPLDGKNVWTAIQNNKPSPVDNWYWAWRQHDVVRTPEWKMYRYFDRVELYDIKNDLSETTDVAAAHPDIVKKLTEEAKRWSKSTGFAPSSQVPELDNLEAKPAGDVIEVIATQTADRVNQKDWLMIPLGIGGLNIKPGDYFEYDVCVLDDSDHNGGFGCFSIKKDRPICMGRGDGIDQFGRELLKMPGVQAGKGKWEHRVHGIGPEAPTALGNIAIALGAPKAGKYHLLFDNIRVRNSDGSVQELWVDGSSSGARIRKTVSSPNFENIEIQVKKLDSFKP
ncbi:MAG: sulfatase family protein, partial [Thermoguttaceae bacterium]